MERFQNRSDMIKFMSFDDGTGSRIFTNLNKVDSRSRKIGQERVAVVNFGVNERSIAIVEAVEQSIVLRIRRRSRILKMHDLETEEMC